MKHYVRLIGHSVAQLKNLGETPNSAAKNNLTSQLNTVTIFLMVTERGWANCTCLVLDHKGR